MTYGDLKKVNQEIKTTPIKGKDYAEVNQRIEAFRKLFPMGSIVTDIVSLVDGVVVIKATVSDEEGKVLATGTAYEKEGNSNINRTSFIENCETSAVGRALGLLGIGINVSVASYEEVSNAILNQESEVKEEKTAPKQEEKAAPKSEKKLTTNQVLTLRNICNNHKMPEENVFKLYGRASLAEMTQEDWGHFNQIGQEMLNRWDEEHGNEGERTA